jgi:hypothetical protein
VIAASFIGKQRPRIARQEARTRVLRVAAYPEVIRRADPLPRSVTTTLACDRRS